MLRGTARGDDRPDRPAAGDGTDAGSCGPASRRLGDEPGRPRPGSCGRACSPGSDGSATCETELDLALAAARAAGDRRRVTAVLARRRSPRCGARAPSPGRWALSRRASGSSRITPASPAVEATSIALPGRARGAARPLRHCALDARRRRGPPASNSASNTVCSRRACTPGSSSCSPTIPRQPSRTCVMRSEGSASSGSAPTPARPPPISLGRCCCRDVSTRPTTWPPTAMRSPARTCRPRSPLVPPRRRSSPPAARPTQALALADEAVRLATDTDLVFDHANALSTLARVRAAAGDADGAQRAASAARDLFTQKGATVAVEVGAPEFGTDCATH